MIYSRYFASSETWEQIVGARENLNGRKKMARRKVKNETSSKRSRSFWLLIGARKLFCFSAHSEGSRPNGVVSCVLTRKVDEVQLFAMFILAVHCPQRNIYTRGEKIQLSEQNARENVRNIDDYLTGKHAGPFAGIIESFRKYSPIH